MRIKSFVTGGILAGAAPLLLANGSVACYRCIRVDPTQASEQTLLVEDSAWHEIEVQEAGHYYVQVALLEGDAELAIVPLFDSDVGELHCTSSTTLTRCEFDVASRGRVGVSIVPSDYSAEVAIGTGRDRTAPSVQVAIGTSRDRT